MLACRLATILLRGVTRVNYQTIESDNSPARDSHQQSTLPGYASSDRKSETSSTSIAAGDAHTSTPSFSITSAPVKPKFFVGEKLVLGLVHDRPVTARHGVNAVANQSSALVHDTPECELQLFFLWNVSWH